MKLADFVPSKATQEALQGVETQLQSRRYAGNWSLAVAFLASAFKIGQIVWEAASGHEEELNRLRDVLLNPGQWNWQHFVDGVTSGTGIFYLVAFVAAGVWVMLRYTGFLFKQSQSPFRYTFSIETFTQVKDTPGAGFMVEGLDQMNLLTNDLVERLKRRVQRFSFLEKAGADGTAAIAKGLNAISHFHIKAEYAVRKDESDDWVIHVWPRIRIGAEGNAFTLANPVRLPFVDHSDQGESDTRGVLSLDEYQRLIERVYSSIATEIYKQIEIDLRDKMTLFPTLSLRALARYVEAEDFETSNTIDAYDRALEMYQTSLDELKASFLHTCRRFLQVRSALEAEAKTKLGHSRCRIYRRLASEMAARGRNPIFDSPKRLESAIGLLTRAYNSFFPLKRLLGRPLRRRAQDIKAHELGAARNVVVWPLQRKRNYRRVRGELCEALAVGSLAYSVLDGSDMAGAMLKLANTLAHPPSDSESGADCSDRVSLILLLTQAELEPRLQVRLTTLGRAIELNLDSEIALYRHAYYSDLLARNCGYEITQERVDFLCDKYEEVLRANPANIASLIGQGYLLWLADDLPKARRKFLSGIELQKIVKQTFVGDLKYGLARVEVELAHRKICEIKAPPQELKKQITAILLTLKKAVFPYEEAIVADPLVAASYTGQQGKTQNSYFKGINSRILQRYKTFAARVRHIGILVRRYQLDLGQIPDVLLSYAWNDYGNACVNYYLRFEYATGKEEYLNRSLQALERARRLNPDNPMIQYNWFLVAAGKGKLTAADIEKIYAGIDELPFAARVSVVIQAMAQWQDLLRDIDIQNKDGLGQRDRDFSRSSFSSRDDSGGIETEDGFTQVYRDQLRKGIQSLDKKIKTLERLKSLEEMRARNSTVSQGKPLSETPVSQLGPGGVTGGQQGTDTKARDEPSFGRPDNKQPPDEKKDTPPTDRKPFSGAYDPKPNASEKRLKKRRDIRERLKKRLLFDMLEEPVRAFAAEITALAPFEEKLRCVRTAPLKRELAAALRPETYAEKYAKDWKERRSAVNPDLDRILKPLEGGLLEEEKLPANIEGGSKLGDQEVNVLASFAQIFSGRLDEEAKAGSLRVCEFLLLNYRRDDFDLNWAAFQNTREEGEKKEKKAGYFQKLARTVEQSILADPQSCYLRKWALDLCIEEVRKLHKDNEFLKGVERLEKEREHCGAFPGFHDWLAYAYEKADEADKDAADKAAAEKAAAGTGDDAEPWGQASGRVLAQLAECSTIEPTNDNWRDAQLLALGQALAFGSTFLDPLKGREDRKLLDVEISTASIEDLEFTAGGLSPKLQKKIKDLRDSLKRDFGFILPGINFRDNRNLSQGQFRVVTRGVPSSFDSLPGDFEDALTHLARRLEREAALNAAWLISADDCLARLPDSDKTSSDGMQNTPQTLAGLIWVYKGLLAEGASIAEFAPIADAFRDCRSRGLGLILSLEEIRGLSEVRKRLRGNSTGEPGWIERLPPELDRRVEESIDFNPAEPLFTGSAVLASEVRSVGRQAIFSAGDALVVLLTSPAVRPFVRKMVASLDIPVLSYHEILPSLLSRVKEPNAKEPNALATKTPQAAAGN